MGKDLGNEKIAESYGNLLQAYQEDDWKIMDGHGNFIQTTSHFNLFVSGTIAGPSSSGLHGGTAASRQTINAGQTVPSTFTGQQYQEEFAYRVSCSGVPSAEHIGGSLILPSGSYYGQKIYINNNGAGRSGYDSNGNPVYDAVLGIESPLLQRPGTQGNTALSMSANCVAGFMWNEVNWQIIGGISGSGFIC